MTQSEREMAQMLRIMMRGADGVGGGPDHLRPAYAEAWRVMVEKNTDDAAAAAKSFKS
jgi:hypothetical protein